MKRRRFIRLIAGGVAAVAVLPSVAYTNNRRVVVYALCTGTFYDLFFGREVWVVDMIAGEVVNDSAELTYWQRATGIDGSREEGARACLDWLRTIHPDAELVEIPDFRWGPTLTDHVGGTISVFDSSD